MSQEQKSWAEIHGVIYTNSGDTRIVVKPNPDIEDHLELVIAQESFCDKKWSGNSTIYLDSVVAKKLIDMLHHVIEFGVAAKQAKPV